MNTRNVTLVLFLLLMTVACKPGPESIYVKKGKSGGIYEENTSGKLYLFNDINWIKSGNPNARDSAWLDTSTFISFDEFEHVSKQQSNNSTGFDLLFQFSKRGTSKFAQMSERNIGKRLYLVANGKIMTAPTVLGAIPDGKVNLSVGTAGQTDELINYLKQ